MAPRSLGNSRVFIYVTRVSFVRETQELTVHAIYHFSYVHTFVRGT